MPRVRLKPIRACLLLLAMAVVQAAGAAFEPEWGTVGVFSAASGCGVCHRASPDQDPNLPAVMRNPLQDNGMDISPYRQWQHSVMAHALNDPYFTAAVDDETTLLPQLAGFIEDKCLTCHAPMARTHAHQAATDLVQDDSCMLPDGCYRLEAAVTQDPAMEGVSCTLCHQVRDEGLGADDSFSGGYVIAAADEAGAFTIYGPYEAPLVNPMQVRSGYLPEHGLQVTGSAHCATCHTLYTPVVDINTGEPSGGRFLEQGPFLEWQNSIYLAGAPAARECQDCHMPDPDPGLYKTRIAIMPSGAVNADWPERQPFFTHSMVGGNAYILELLRDYREALGIEAGTTVEGFESQAIQTRELLESAATLEFTSLAHADGELAISVHIANHTGHKLPTGFPSRRMWIHLAVHDPSDRLIFDSGAADATGRISTDAARLAAACLAPSKPPGFDSSACFEPHRDMIDDDAQVAIFETVLADTNDDITYILLYAGRYLKDNRLPPAGFTGDRANDIEPQTLPAGIGSDSDFNRDGNGEGTGADTVHYRIPTAGIEGRYRVTAQLLYQAIQPAFVQSLSSETDRVEAFKTLYQDNPPATETLATASAEIDVANDAGNGDDGGDSGGGGGGGGCSINSRSAPDPVLLLLLLAVWRCIAGPAARITRDQYRGEGIRPCR